MKKNIFILLYLFSACHFLTAQINSANTKTTSLRNLPNDSRNDEGANVPELIKINFDKAYPRNVAAWTIVNKHYVAEFKDSLRIGHILSYDEYGNLKTINNEMSPAAVPAPIDEYIAKRYPNQSFTVWSMVNADGTNLYYYTTKTETLWFDPNGNFRNKTKNNLK